MKLLHCLVTFALLALTSQAEDYNGYKTFRVYPKNQDQTFLLNLLNGKDGFDFWTRAAQPGLPVDVMVSPNKQQFFTTLMYNNHFNASILISNVATVIPSPVDLAFRSFSPVVADGRISFTKYERLATIQAYLKDLASSYPNLVSLFNLGQTSEGRDILGIKISTGGSGKPAIFVDCGIHAREWAAPATGLYIINQLVENSSKNQDLIKNVDWYIIPVLNPDGYEYTHTNDRMWRKNRSPGKSCKGADPNRNYGFHWMEVGASSYECSDTYAGKSAFSELETSQMRNFIAKINGNKSIKLYLTFHAYGQYLLYPWGWTSSYPPNHAELQSLAESVNEAIMSVRGTEYTIGSSTNVLYPAAGGSDDWMMSVGVPLAYTIELPGGGSQGFNPPASSIQPIVTETFEGVKVYAKYVALKYHN